MLTDDFKKQHAKTVRDLAERADPFIKQRLLDLAARYETEPPVLHSTPIDLQFSGQGSGPER